MLDPHVLTFKTPSASLNSSTQPEAGNYSEIDMPVGSIEPSTPTTKHAFAEVFKEIEIKRFANIEGEMSQGPLVPMIDQSHGDNMIVIDDDLLTANGPITFITPPLTADESFLNAEGTVDTVAAGLVEDIDNSALANSVDPEALLTVPPIQQHSMPVSPPLKLTDNLEASTTKPLMVNHSSSEGIKLPITGMNTVIGEESELPLPNSLLKTPVATAIETEANVLPAITTKLQNTQFLQTLRESFADQIVGESDIDVETLKQLGLINNLNQPNQLVNAETSKAPLTITIPFQQAQWGAAVAEKVMWMSSHGLQEAEIQMDPPELGPLQVKVSIENDQAHVSFVVQHANVKDALEQTAMRLREMFEAEGIDLVDVDVSDHSANEDESTFTDEQLAEDTLNGEDVINNDEQLTTGVMIDSSGIDAYV